MQDFWGLFWIILMMFFFVAIPIALITSVFSLFKNIIKFFRKEKSNEVIVQGAGSNWKKAFQIFNIVVGIWVVISLAIFLFKKLF